MLDVQSSVMLELGIRSFIQVENSTYLQQSWYVLRKPTTGNIPSGLSTPSRITF